MTYEHFKTKLNTRIFGEDLNREILETVIKNPQRYIGLFRVTNAKTKLIQNVTQSCEIKFGDFLEDILTEYLAEMGYENLDKNIGTDSNGNRLNADQFFRKGNNIFLVEQKVRDDHDSTKKRGQYDNLTRKIEVAVKAFPNCDLKACMWFSDASLCKNKNYYLSEMEKSNRMNPRISVSLFYGKEIFEKLFERADIWEELISYLKQNKSERSQEILNVPDFDTSKEIRLALEQIKKDEPRLIKKLVSNDEQYIELRKELFPTGKNLEGL